MPASDYDIAKLKRAYRTLDVPLDASARSIKQSYRQLLKRWHPDLYASGTSAYAEATQMAELINEAYSSIEDAPLRYYTGTYAGRSSPGNDPPTRSTADGTEAISEEFVLTTAKIEYAVRFVCGALFGIFLSFDLAFSVLADFSGDLWLVIPGGLAIVLACAFASGRFGDKFWYWIFRRWWLWP
jgi:curved DNA-binding protein CbpA